MHGNGPSSFRSAGSRTGRLGVLPPTGLAGCCSGWATTANMGGGALAWFRPLRLRWPMEWWKGCRHSESLSMASVLLGD